MDWGELRSAIQNKRWRDIDPEGDNQVGYVRDVLSRMQGVPETWVGTTSTGAMVTGSIQFVLARSVYYKPIHRVFMYNIDVVFQTHHLDVSQRQMAKLASIESIEHMIRRGVFDEEST